MIKFMWISGFFYGATSFLSKSVTELAFSFDDVLHVTLFEDRFCPPELTSSNGTIPMSLMDDLEGRSGLKRR